MAVSYLGLCIPPNRDSDTYYDYRCNLWGKNCHIKFIQSWYNRDHKLYNKCLLQSEYGRPSVNASGEICYKKKGTSGTEVCAKFDANSNTMGQPHQVITDTDEVPGGVGQAGLGADMGKFMEQIAATDKKILIGAAVVLFLLVR
jgi:hypothetical protein